MAGLEHARKLADLPDARAVFDDAAVALHDASVALSGLERALFTHGSSFRAMVPEAVPDAESATERLKSIRGRPGVRLPTGNAAVAEFETAHEAGAATKAAWAQDPSPDAAAGETHKILDAEHRRLIDATDRFMRAATKTVGAKLP
jgi:hypothetical protein